MCAGIPVVVSDEVGCVADLVKHGVNGYHTKPGDVGSLTAALRNVLTDEDLRKRMGAASLSIIGTWGYEQCRQGMLAALAGVSR
jgi:glycosyltransferase involved in cell wall biosynthesis